MDKEAFKRKLEKYLAAKGWNKHIVNGEEILYRNNISDDNENYEHLSKKIYRTGHLADRIRHLFQKRGLTEHHYDSVVNRFPDSDFVVAALQYINYYLYDDRPLSKELIYSFQPVIRSVPKAESTANGFLRSFINVGTIGIMQDIYDYFNQLELWIDALSICHIHISRIGLRIKTETRAFDGVGIEFMADGQELGQSNFYELKCSGWITGITDMGFGLERICWAANGWDNFVVSFQSPEAYYLGYDDVSDRINLIVLLIASGVTPSGGSASAVLRRAIQDLACKYARLDYRPFIRYAVSQTCRYLNCNHTYEQIQGIFDAELDRAICLKIGRACGTRQYERLAGDCERYCDSLIGGRIRRTKSN